MAWFWLHMPEKGPFVENKSANWSERLSSLTANDDCWYPVGWTHQKYSSSVKDSQVFLSLESKVASTIIRFLPSAN
jgi:hypothetical protein